MTDRPEDPGVPGEPPMAPPPPLPPPPPVAPIGLRSETEVRSGGIGGRIAAGALGLLLLVGGVAFAATQMASDDAPGSPQEAVAQMLAAIEAEDVLGVLATLDARERDALSQPVEDLFQELERLEVLDESFDLRGVEGVDLEFEGLTFREEAVREDLARVYLTGGTATYRVDTDEIPIGDFLADNLERFGVEYRGIEQTETETIDEAEADDTFLVARATDDGWRVSLGYTAVEVARIERGHVVPAIGDGIEPVGADSPEAAVEGFLQAVVGIDIEGALARLSPAELGAVHDYWPALVGDAELPTRDDVPADIELTDLVLRSTTDGDRGRVFIDSIGVDVVTEDFQGGATVADGCIEVRGDVRATVAEEAGVELPEGPICQDDVASILEEVTGGAGFGLAGFGGLDPLALDDGDAPALGVTVVEIDGGWFVAPLGTYADFGLAVLETLDRQDLDDMVDAVEDFFGAGFLAGGDLGSGFVPPGMGGGFEAHPGAEELGGAIGGEPDAATIDALLGEVLSAFTSDPDVAACALEQLHLQATTEQLHELVDAYQHQYEPSVEAQDVLFGVLSACGG